VISSKVPSLFILRNDLRLPGGKTDKKESVMVKKALKKLLLCSVHWHFCQKCYNMTVCYRLPPSRAILFRISP